MTMLTVLYSSGDGKNHGSRSRPSYPFDLSTVFNAVRIPEIKNIVQYVCSSRSIKQGSTDTVQEPSHFTNEPSFFLENPLCRPYHSGRVTLTPMQCCISEHRIKFLSRTTIYARGRECQVLDVTNECFR